MSIESFDLYNPPSDFINNVYKYYNLLREKSPIHKNSDGSYILTRYKDLVGVYRNFKVWSSDKRSEFGAKFGSSPLFEHHTTSVVFVDPPDHTRIRKIFQQAFTPKSILSLERNINKLVDSYLVIMHEKKKFDFVSDFSFRLPVDVVCSVLGVPSEDRHLIRDWAHKILGALEPKLTNKQLDEGSSAVINFKQYLKDQIKFRKTHKHINKANEVLSLLIEAEGLELSETELLHQCIFMLNAGHETSTNMLSHGLNELINHRDQYKSLQKEPGRIDTAIDEILRFQPPIQINNRRCLEKTKLGDVVVPEGTSVHMIIAGANRDPLQFLKPETFDISRSPNRHLSFGLGIHICAGINLARVEAKVAFQSLMSSFREINLLKKPKVANRIRFREIKEMQIEISPF
ncbi:cytochrome P450 [bacterium]|nr:cytochrome P450 [bacterium]